MVVCPRALASDCRFAAQRQRHVEAAAHFKAVKTRRRDADDFKGSPIERKLAAENIPASAKFPLPESVADLSFSTSSCLNA
jgi:hypothetical protein